MAGETVLQPTPRQTPVPGTGLLATPFQFVLTGSENLQIRSACSLAGVVVAVQGRLLQSDGSIVPIGFTHTPNSDRSIATQNFALGPGTLLTLTCFALTGTPVSGQCFVQVQIIQGLTGATYVLGTLLQGYVTSFQCIAWPGSPIHNSLEGRGYTHVITVADPGPHAGVTLTAPANTRWRLQSAWYQIATDATTPVRFAILEVSTGGSIVISLGTQTTFGASLTAFISFTSGAQIGTAHDTPVTNTFITASAGPGIELRAGDVLSLGWETIGTGDQLSNTRVTVEEWLELN